MSGVTADAIQTILSLADVQMVEIDSRKYADKTLKPIIPPVVSEMKVNTLTGIRDYLADNPDRVLFKDVIIHVVDENTVSLVSCLADEWSQRNSYLFAKHTPRGFGFGQYQPIENFIIAMQTYFVQDDTTARIIQLCGNLKQETGVQYTDDGISQEVQAKTGIARIENVVLPNPVQLAPYRTFLEVSQPASNFVFRIKKGDDGPKATLYEADGGTWTLEAIKRIRDWLRINVSETITIIA